MYTSNRLSVSPDPAARLAMRCEPNPPRLVTAVLMCAALGVPAAARADAFQNGSFESPGISTGQSPIETPTDAPTGWLGGGNLGGYALFYEQSGLYDLSSQSGLANVGFGGNNTAGASIEQTFDTVVGVSYTVGYYTSAQQLGNGAQSYSATAVDGATVLATQSADIPDTEVAWAYHSFVFVAASASSTLRFADTSVAADSGNDNWALDSVSVVSSVPEPGAFSLFGAGLVGLLLKGRRSSKR